jgi:hypothetical protein
MHEVRFKFQVTGFKILTEHGIITITITLTLTIRMKRFPLSRLPVAFEESPPLWEGVKTLEYNWWDVDFSLSLQA